MRLLRRQLLSALLLAPAAVAAGCSAITGDDDPEIWFETMYVAPQKVPCTGMIPTECLMVRESSTAEWTNIFDTIHGFEWEPGFNYKIRVMINEIENPPADGSSRYYRLVQVLEKTPAQ